MCSGYARAKIKEDRCPCWSTKYYVLSLAQSFVLIGGFSSSKARALFGVELLSIDGFPYDSLSLEVGSILRIQWVGYDVLGFLGVGTTFGIFQNILFLYLVNTAYMGHLDTAYWSWFIVKYRHGYAVSSCWIRRIEIKPMVVKHQSR
nr:hypothetical protein [Tanacetum cinerariifolium]